MRNLIINLFISFLLLFSIPCIAQTCQPTFINGCSNKYIDSVYVEGYLQNIESYGTGCTGTSPNYTTVYPDSICWRSSFFHDFKITHSDSNMFFSVFLDQNGDGVFNSWEIIHGGSMLQGTNVVSFSHQFLIPLNPQPGPILKLRIIAADSIGTFGNAACAQYNEGECEDYVIKKGINNYWGGNTLGMGSCGCVCKIYSPNTTYGCDSVINPINNAVYYSNTSYEDTLVNQYGCDSIVLYHFDINKFNNNYISHQFNTLTNNANMASYQWYNCNTQSIILGETAKTYTLSQAGNYACIVTDTTGCSDTSACYSFWPLEIDDLDRVNRINYSPNPTDGIVNIQFENSSSKKINIYDLQGRLVMNATTSQKNYKLDLSNIPKGIYIFKTVINGKNIYDKILKL